MTKPTSIRLADGVADQLDRLAEALGRPRSWVIEQAIARYIEDESWQVSAVREALEDYRSGRAATVPHGDVMKRIEERLRPYRDAHPVA